MLLNHISNAIKKVAEVKNTRKISPAVIPVLFN